MPETIDWNGERIPIKRSRRKTLALHVRDGNPELRIPTHADHGDVLSFIEGRQAWLDRVRSQQALRSRELPDFSKETRCPLMDRRLNLTLEVSRKVSWRLTGENLHLTLGGIGKDQIHHVLTDFYKIQARFYLTEKTLELVHKRGWESRLTDIRFRRTKTKWGHCTTEGRIQYNWLVMLAPERIVDYLVAHETAHLLHPHHGVTFWDEVERSHPGWREDRRWLHDNGHRLLL